MRTTRVFDITSSAWLKKPRYISSCGGTRSGKTFSIIQLLYLQCLGEERRNAPPTINSIVSESMPHLKRGAIRDFKTILQGEGVWSDEKWSETDKYYRFSNGSIIEFFSIDNAGKVYGSARDNLFINECQHIDYEIARQLFVRTRGHIILDYNPTNHFWVMDKIECKDNCIRVHSTYKDNGFLTPEQVREIEDNQDDKNWWKVFGEGKEGTLDGLIYEFEQIDHMPPRNADKPQGEKTAEELYADSLQEIQGIDFGFTNDPTARVQVYADPKRKHAYIRERCYRTHMQNKHIIEDLKEDGVGRRVEIFADCAEPKSIADIQDAGFNVIACNKDAPVKSDKLKFQLQWMQGWKFFVTKDSLNLIEELRNYTWAKDKDGNLLNEPIDKWNHCFTGDTLVMTDKGMVRIDHIVPGMQVATSDGYHEVVHLWKNGCRKICSITLEFANFEIRMNVTPDHKIKVGKEWKKVSELKPGDRLWRLKSSMERHTTSTGVRGISPRVGAGCTGLYGNTTTERFLQGIKYTTRMAIQRTMTSAILNVFHLRNILRNIVNLSLQGLHLTSLSSILQRLDHWHLNGTSQRRGENGTGCIPWEKETDLHNVSANVVERHSCQPMQIQSSVRTIASQSGEETITLMMKPGFALSVERNSVPTDIPVQYVVEGHVLQSIVINEERNEEVFDLLVDGQHEYFANGILVHNCLDALRYGLWTKYGQNAGHGQYSISFGRHGRH